MITLLMYPSQFPAQILSSYQFVVFFTFFYLLYVIPSSLVSQSYFPSEKINKF